MPLQRLIMEIARFDHERSDRRVTRALGFARAMSEAGSQAVPKALIDGLEDKKQSDTTTYLAHEYLNEHWAPAFHSDVAAAFGEAKLTFAATGNLLENFADICFTKDQRALLAHSPAAMQETLKDYFLARTFRRDVFLRGPRPISERRVKERQRLQPLTLTRPGRTITTKIKIPLGEADLSASTYEPAFQALSNDVVRVGDLLDLPELADTKASPSEIIGMSIGSKQAVPAPNTASPASVARVRAFNLAHLRLCAEEGRATAALAGAVIGSAIQISIAEMLTYECLAAGTPAEIEPIAAAVWQLLERRGDKLRNGETVVEGKEDNLAFLRTRAAEILADSLPIWQRIGAI